MTPVIQSQYSYQGHVPLKQAKIQVQTRNYSFAVSANASYVALSRDSVFPLGLQG